MITFIFLAVGILVFGGVILGVVMNGHGRAGKATAAGNAPAPDKNPRGSVRGTGTDD